MPALTGGGLRVAIVVDEFPAEPFLAQQVSGLIDRGLDVHVLCQISDAAHPGWQLLDREAMIGRIHTWPDRNQRLARVGAAITAVTSAARSGPRRLAATMRRESGPRRAGRMLFDARVLGLAPDVLHFQFGDLAARRIHVAEATGIPVTASFRGYDLAYAGLDDPGFYDGLWTHLAGRHTLGTDLRDLAHRRGCPSSLEWTIIPPAVDLDRLIPPDRTDRSDHGIGGPIRVVSVGRLHWKKGLEHGLLAIRMLVDEGVPVHYRIVGGGDTEEYLRWTIRDLDLEDCVELVGPVEPGRVVDHLAWADLFLHPALSEGFGNAVLEAQAMELPVVCSDAEGLAENVQHAVTGYVVDRRDSRRLADGLTRLAQDPILRAAMGSEGRQRVASHFDLETQIDRFVRFFQATADR